MERIIRTLSRVLVIRTAVVYLMVASLALLPNYPLSPLAFGAAPKAQHQQAQGEVPGPFSGRFPTTGDLLSADDISEVQAREARVVGHDGQTYKTVPVVESVFLPDLNKVESFVTHIETRIAQLRAEGGTGRRIQLEFDHVGNAHSVPAQLAWLLNHLAHLTALHPDILEVKWNIVEPTSAMIESREALVTRVLQDWSEELTRVGISAAKQAEELSGHLQELENRAELVGRQLRAFEANLVGPRLEKPLEILELVIPDLLALIDDVRERTLGPRSQEYSLTHHGTWYRQAAQRIASYHAELESARQNGELPDGRNLVDERVLQEVHSISARATEVARLFDEMAGLYRLEFTAGTNTYNSGRSVSDSEKEMVKSILDSVKERMSLTWRKAMGLPRHMSFAMYREIFTVGNHTKAIEDATTRVREMVRVNGLSWKNIKAAYPEMSPETKVMLSLYGSSILRAALGFGVTYAVMIGGVAQHPGQVLNAELGAAVASFWLFFTGVIGLANLHFFAQGSNFDAVRSYDRTAGKYDFYRGFKSNKPFLLAGTLVHSALIALMVQQAYNVNWILPEGVFATTMSAVVLSVFAKFVPTLFLAKNSEKTGQVNDGQSRRHSKLRTIAYGLGFDIFLQTVKSMKLFGVKVAQYDAAKVILWVMAAGGAIAIAKEKYKDWQTRRWGDLTPPTLRDFVRDIEQYGLRYALNDMQIAYGVRQSLAPQKYHASEQTTLMRIKLTHKACAIVF